MSRSESAAAKSSPADYYSSPPTSPQSARAAIKAAPGKSTAKATLQPAIDAVIPNKLPAARKEYVRPVTPPESAASDDEQSEATKEPSKLSTWKAALSLSDMRCGATRKDNKPCENKTSTKKMERIDDIIKLLWIPNTSSLDAETHLDSLAKLAHCHYHDDPPAREARISGWLTVLPGAPRAPSLQKRLRNILGSAPAKCTSVKKDGKPCGNAIGREKRFYCNKTIKKMIQVAMEPKEEEDLTLLAEVLKHHMLCHRHRAQPYKQQDEWTRRVSKFRAACQNEKSMRDRQDPTTAKEEEGQQNVEDSKLVSPPPTPRKQKEVPDPGAYWDTEYLTGRFDILGKRDMVDEDKLALDEIRDTARELLNTDSDKSENEVNDGFVYLYQVPGNKHLVKIGFTTDSVAARLEKWQKDCHRVPTGLYPPAAAAAVPHAHRVERLAHAELMEHRVRVYCERCEKKHVEWFETSVEAAVAVVDKWSRWMRTRPYEQRVTRAGAKWHLKETEAKRLADVPKFLEDLQKDVKEGESM